MKYIALLTFMLFATEANTNPFVVPLEKSPQSFKQAIHRTLTVDNLEYIVTIDESGNFIFSPNPQKADSFIIKPILIFQPEDNP